jgi:hypothetical protein
VCVLESVYGVIFHRRSLKHDGEKWKLAEREMGAGKMSGLYMVRERRARETKIEQESENGRARGRASEKRREREREREKERERVRGGGERERKRKSEKVNCEDHYTA